MNDTVLNPIVSIIIPVYNAEQFLEKCIKSILSQTYSKIEVICVNDGSLDKCLTILNCFATLDKRVRVLNISNAGVSNARNVGLRFSSGSKVMFVDADDWLDEDCVEKLVSLSVQYDCDIVMYPYVSEHKQSSIKRQLFNGQQILIGKDCYRLARQMIGPIGNEVISPTKLDSYGTVWGKLYKREILNDILFVDLKLIGTAEDSLFNMFVFKRAEIVGYCPDVYYHYRRSNGFSLTSGFIPDLKEKRKIMYEIIADSFKDAEEEKALFNRIALDVPGLLINAFDSETPHKEVSELLQDNYFILAIQCLDINRMPIYWKLFYIAARGRFIRMIEFFLAVIKLIRNRLR